MFYKHCNNGNFNCLFNRLTGKTGHVCVREMAVDFQDKN